MGRWLFSFCLAQEISMQRFAVGACCTLAAFLLLVGVVSGYQSVGFKEKIVFVRADPSRGVVSTQAIAAFDQNTGEQTSGHAGPQFADVSRTDVRRNEIAVMNSDGSGVSELHASGSDP